MYFSVLLSVYHKENPEYLDKAILSLINQTITATEIVIVKDGPLGPNLNKIIQSYLESYPTLFKVINLTENKGLGDALNEGLKNCTYEWIARMDSDDICVPDRFELQTTFLSEHPDVVVSGGYIEEFNTVPGDLNRVKKVPLSFEDVKRFSKNRNPINHPSVMFRKSIIIELGSYEKMLFFEDYYLWLKVLHKNHKIVNLNKILLYFRIGNNMIGRRHGYTYAIHELNFVINSNKNKFLSIKESVYFALIRFPLRIIPRGLLNIIYSITRNK